jgi:catechol 2,3-dioxygenase-like lactoylglutathione lyase family enzyme
MEIPPISHQITFFYTRDLEKTARFYEDILGLELLIDQGTCRIYRVSQDGWVGFCQREYAPVETVGVILTIVTQAVDDWYERLVAHGVSFEEPPVVNSHYQIYHCFFHDPNGYLVEIQQFLHDIS